MRVLQWRRPRLNSLCRLWKLLILVTLTSVLLVVPIRNALLNDFMPVLPGLWLPHSTLFLIQVSEINTCNATQKCTCESLYVYLDRPYNVSFHLVAP